jgi:integrase/recombinase XerD
MKMPQRRLKRTRSPGRPPGGGGQAKVLSATELSRVDKCLAGTPNELRNRALLYLQYATGMRVGELAALNTGDVLHRGKIRKEFRLGTEDTKYCKPRTIFVEAPKAISAVIAYLRQRKPELRYSGAEPLFVGKRLNEREGTFRLSANSLAELFRKIYEKSGIVGASSHSGRRWFMTELARAGIHPRIIQQRAGHSSLATTQRYIEVTPDQERRAVRTIRL